VVPVVLRPIRLTQVMSVMKVMSMTPARMAQAWASFSRMSQRSSPVSLIEIHL
jgi:hypothetical protein